MIGAEALLRSLVASDVDVVFANPGTSEMHFVATLDAVSEMRGVLALFEGVATGAADGYARMRESPAAVLLHLGPGLGNGLANLHNARRSHAPVVAIVGDHATYHKRYDAPLEFDIDTVARNVSTWIRRSVQPESVGADAAAAVAAACGPPGQVATLILPADVSWSEGGSVAPAEPRAQRLAVRSEALEDAAGALRSKQNAALLLGGSALREPGLLAAFRIAAATGAEVLAETFPARAERGAGIPVIQRLAYLAEMASGQLDGLRHLILVDTTSPVSFFAYPGKPSDLVPEGCEVTVLAGGGDDAVAALELLAGELGAGAAPAAGSPARPDRPVESSALNRSPAPSARSCPRERSFPTRPTPAGPSYRGSRRARLGTTGSASRAAPSARVSRSRSEQRSPARIARCWRSRRTAPRSTPCKRSGPWLGNSST